MEQEHTHCPQCQIQVRPSDLASHLESEHGSTNCPECSEQIKNKDFETHRIQECLQRKIPCSICELELPMVEMAEHEQWCGSRTELCTMCERYIKLKDLDIHISTNCQYPEVEKKEKTPLSSDQDLAQRLRAYEFRREELNRALGLDGNWNRIPATLRNDQEYMNRFHPEQAEAVEAGNQMLRIEQMADAMMTGDGFLDRYNRRREMFGESDEGDSEDVLTRARRRRRMNEESAAAGGDTIDADSGRRPRTLDEIRKQRQAREPDDDARSSRFLWVGGGGERNSPGVIASSDPPRAVRNGVALPGLTNKAKDPSPKEKTPKTEDCVDTIKIPCEFCMNLFPLEKLMDHQDRCGPNSQDNQELPSNFLDNLLRTSPLRQRASDVVDESLGLLVPSALPTEPGEDALPCEFCEDLFPFDVLIQHQSVCDKNPSRPTSARENALAKLNQKQPGLIPTSSHSASPLSSSSFYSADRRPSRGSSSNKSQSPSAPLPPTLAQPARERTYDTEGLIQPKKLLNPVVESRQRRELHKDLLKNIGPSEDRYGLGPVYSASKVLKATSGDSKPTPKSTDLPNDETLEDVMKAAKLSREKLLYQSGKIKGKQTKIDLSGDTNARYHAKIPALPRATPGNGAGMPSHGGGVAPNPTTAYADEASDRYLSHRQRMMAATRERMGDAAASSRSEDWASQILDNLLDDDEKNARGRRSGSRDRPTPPRGSGTSRSRAGQPPLRPSGLGSPASKYAAKK